MGAGACCQSNIALLADDQQHLIVLQIFCGDADKCSNRRIESVLFQFIQRAQALREDNSRIESAALGCAQPHLAAITDQQQDVAVELLCSRSNNRLQS